MAITFRTAAAAASGNSSAPAIGISASAAVGDVAIAQIAFQASTSVTAVPSGWTLIRSDSSGAGTGGVTSSLYWKSLVSGDPGSTFTWTLGSSVPVATGVTIYTGPSNVAPVDVQAANSSTSGTTATSPSVTTTYASEQAIEFFAAKSSSGNIQFSSQPSPNSRYNSGLNLVTVAASDQAIATPSSTGTKTAGTTGGTTGWTGQTIAIKENQTPTAATITAPNGGETISGSTNITWTAGTDDDTLVYDLSYSKDNGTTWTVITNGVSGTSYLWNTSALRSSNQYRVRVQSRDLLGLTSDYDESNANFTVYNAASPSSTATAFSNQRVLDVCQNGNKVIGFRDDNANARFRVSTDSGVSWSEITAMPIYGVENFSIFIDVDDYFHVVWRQSQDVNGRTDNRIYYMRGTPNAGRTSWTWGTELRLFTGGGLNYPAMVVHRNPWLSGWYAAQIITSTGSVAGSQTVVDWWQVDISSGGTATLGSHSTLGVYNSTGGNESFPSIDFRHTGDGKTAHATPNLYASWTAGKTGSGFGIRFKKAAYASGNWTWGTEREIDNTVHAATTAYPLVCMFDGTRVIIGGDVTVSGGSGMFMLYERDEADTTTTTRTLMSSHSGATGWFGGSMTYDAAGNVYFIGRQWQSVDAVQLYKWDRSTTTLGSPVLLDNPGNTTEPAVSMKRGYSSNRLEWVYTAGNNAPYTVKYDGQAASTGYYVPQVML